MNAERAFAKRTFDPNNGVDDSKTYCYYYDGYINREPSWTGKIFLGWNSKADGSGNWYSPYDNVSAVRETVLYAQVQDMPEEPWLTLKSTAPAYSFQGTNVKVVDMDEPFPAEVTGGKVFAWQGSYYSAYHGEGYTDTYLPGETWDASSRVKEFVLTSYVQNHINLYGVLKGNGGLHEEYRQQIPLVKISGVASATALRPYLNDYGYFYRDGHAHVGYAEESMAWAATEGIIGGVSDTALAPGAKATRAQIATMLMRFVEGNG